MSPSAPLLLARLAAVVGTGHVDTDQASLALHGADLSWIVAQAPLAMVAPASIDELARVVALVTAAGHASIARGGGMSYTGGAVAEQAGSVLIDMRRLDRIVDINTEDMYVTVECGCTWKKLYEALRERGVRTPYFGPLSGRYATIGGALAQNGVFMGSGQYGAAADNCLGLQVVLADGSLLQTGSAARRAGSPFFRHFGPDLSGIFTSDGGAFGIKAQATLKLIRTPAVTVCSSWGFDTAAAMLAAQTELARCQITAECFGFNPAYNTAFQHKSLTLGEALQTARDVLRSSASPLAAVRRLWQLAAGGKGVLSSVQYSLHVVLDAASQGAADAAAATVAGLCAPHARRLSNALPMAFRAQPFRAVRNLMLGADGEVWIPAHGVFPLSQAAQAVATTEAFFVEHAALMAQHGISSTYLTFCPGLSFIVEPSFYWSDALGPFRLSLIEPAFQQRWGGLPAQPEIRAVALRLRAELRDRYLALGSCHLQLGKYYPYAPAIGNDPALKLVQNIKHLLDPQARMNPGALGLR